MVEPNDIKVWIEQNLPNSKVEIDGDGQHFNAVIVCPQFKGKSMVQQHQMVYQALGDKMKSEIHALSMRTMSED
jgi:acid stress-induced BolA-like protein IbaG/YrbA